ncbi:MULTISPECIES: helix-turn-helix domain-containing protein [unclassified Yoonia]|uniref:helix-turn-helix domain-containing protein n=1 Tax=unclassified Yoonia TaxID=2629118 RepID=UPI002AFF11FD|nr:MULTISPECIES: helix-turn-helix domain-containing protein [unclassified Yoonia]
MDGLIDLQNKASDRPEIRTGHYQHHVLQEDALCGWQQEYHLLQGGAFHGEIAQIDFGDITIFREKTNLPLINRFCLPQDKVNLAAALPGSADAINHYGEYHKGETFLLHFAEEREVMVTGPLDMIGVTFTPPAALAETTHYWHRIAGQTSDFITWIALLLGSFARSSDVTDLHRIAPLLIADRLSFVIDALVPDTGRVSKPKRSNPAAIVRACLDGMRHIPQSDLSVVTLAQRLDLPAAALRQAFRDTLDQDLDAMLVALRMSHVHRILARADARAVTVSAVAADHGFLHWGRFAQRYRAMFGELPVATLRRSSASS